MKMKYNRIISLLLALCLVAGIIVIPTGSYAAALDWNGANVLKGANNVPFRPFDKYVSTQNPPSFLWNYVTGAENYEIIICSDEALKNVKYRYETGFNMITPPETFETGVNYYWAVRYYISGKPSEWSDVRRFRIDPDANVFTMDNIDEIMARIPESHPRVFTRPEDLEEFRNLKNTNEYAKKTYEYYLSQAQRYMAAGKLYGEPAEEAAKDTATGESAILDKGNLQRFMNDAAGDMTDQITACAFIYLIDGNKEIGEYAKQALLKMTEWDTNGISSTANAEQASRSIAIECAKAYDWIYDLLSESERKKVLTMLKERIDPFTIYTEFNRTVNYYGSYEWVAYQYAGLVAYATYGEIEGYDKLLRDTIETYSMVPRLGYEDGAWAAGNHYWSGGNVEKEFIDVLALADVINFYDKAFFKNEYLYTTYAIPPGSYGSFGQGAGLYTESGSDETTNAVKRTAYFNNNGYSKFFVNNARGMGSVYHVSDYYAAQASEVEETTPANLPLSHHFKDVGLVTMTNDNVDPNRIQMSFSSGFFGTYNHQMDQQNGMVMTAFGESLLIHSGFYDGYGTPHELNMYRAASAHNTITTANSNGQKSHSMDSKGNITNFINHVDFDVTSGDASEAYPRLEKFVRNIVYIRPDIFVVIDDLKVSETEQKKEKFEWWLNARRTIEVHESEKGARLLMNDAVLDATVQYPQNIKTYYSNNWTDSRGTPYAPVGTYATTVPHKKVWFETERLNETKMVVTLDVHQNKIEARDVDTEYFDNYIKMTFEDGTIMYVNLGSKEETVDTGDIVFTGDAVVYNDESIMLVSGTSLTYSGTEIIKSEDVVSVCMGKDEIGISTYTDSRISINTDNDYVDEFTSVTDYYGREVSSAIGITYEAGILKEEEAKGKAGAKKTEDEATAEKVYTVEEAEDYITFTAQKDSYSLMLNGKSFVSEERKGQLSVTVDGEEKTYELDGYSRRDGSGNYKGSFTVPAKKYRVVDKNIELDFGGMEMGDIKTISAIDASSQVEKNYIVLESIESIKLNSTFDSDYDAVKNKAAVVVEAEAFDRNTSSGGTVYTTRAFLSGGAGLTEFNGKGSQMRYTFEIKEAGVYDLVVKYAAWTDQYSDKGTTVRSFTFQGKDYEFGLDSRTVGVGRTPEEWHAAIMDSGLELQPGTYEIIFEPISGSWNFDWFALLKR